MSFPGRIHAQIYWNGTGTTWNSNTDWSTVSNATTPNPARLPAGDLVVFNITTLNTAQALTLDANQAALGITFSSTGTVSISDPTNTFALSIGASGVTDSAGSGADTSAPRSC